MSAYIVDREHIAFLVCAAMSRSISRHTFTWYIKADQRNEQLGSGDLEKAVEVANMLWLENIKSVSHRYPGESSATLPGPIGGEFVIEAKHLPLWWAGFKPVNVLKACDCYEYQSCEHDGWESSDACAFINRLRAAAWHSLAGYDDAAWGAPEGFGKQTPLRREIRTL